jgi:4-hydroxybenzoate polyprenyltransferase
MTFLERIACYCKEQLEPGSRFILSVVITIYIFLMLMLDKSIQFFNWGIMIPALSSFLLLLYYRISDEFKDYETDKKFFPDRPIPSGRLLLSDLKIMLITVSVLSIVLNLIFPIALIEFGMAFLFTYAMAKWFFVPKLISTNRMLAFFTHAPVGFFLYYYVEKYLLNLTQNHWNFSSCLSIIGFVVFPGLTWEILRKTYLPQDEKPGYQIYSTMLGFKGALFFGLGIVVLTIINNFFLIHFFPFLYALKIPLLIINFVLIICIILQAYKPWIKNLKPIAEVYMGIHLLVPIGYLVWLTMRLHD